VPKKVKLSKEEFAEPLIHWIAIQIGMKGIKQDAKVFDLTSEAPLDSREAKELFGVHLSNPEEFTRLFEELLPLNLWLAVLACHATLKDAGQRTDCLDIFHKQFFDHIAKEAVGDFEQWIESLAFKYDEYSEAMKKGPLSLAYLIQNNLHGQGYPNAIMQFRISLYVEKALKTLTEVIDRCEIE
jgi:hypothetical protein